MFTVFTCKHLKCLKNMMTCDLTLNVNAPLEWYMESTNDRSPSSLFFVLLHDECGDYTDICEVKYDQLSDKYDKK